MGGYAAECRDFRKMTREDSARDEMKRQACATLRHQYTVLGNQGRQLAKIIRNADSKNFVLSLTYYANKAKNINYCYQENEKFKFISEIFNLLSANVDIKALSEKIKEINIARFKDSYSDGNSAFYDILKYYQNDFLKERPLRMGWGKTACVIASMRANHGSHIKDSVLQCPIKIISAFLGAEGNDSGFNKKILDLPFFKREVQRSIATEYRDLCVALEKELIDYESKTQPKDSRKVSIQQIRNKIAEQQESKEDTKTKLHELIAVVKGHINATTKDHHDLQGWNLFARKDSRLASAYQNALKVIVICDVAKIPATVVSFDKQINMPGSQGNVVEMRPT
jgi:hypothetical protein